MKKFLCLLLVILSFGLASCGTDSTKTFTKEGITVTLTNNYHEQKSEDFPVFYASKKAAFIGNKENLADFVDYDFSDKENPAYYGNFVLVANNLQFEGNQAAKFQNMKNNNGQYSAYTIYDAEGNGVAYRYLMVVMLGKDYAYCMNFSTARSEFVNYQEKFMEFAKTICVE